jgi:hypothetical protein
MLQTHFESSRSCNIERRVRKILDVAHVIEMACVMKMVDVLGLNADLAQHFARRMPAAHAIGIGQHFAVSFVVVADVHHRKLALALDHDVAIRQLARALIVHAVDQAALRIVRHRRIFHHPQ